MSVIMDMADSFRKSTVAQVGAVLAATGVAVGAAAYANADPADSNARPIKTELLAFNTVSAGKPVLLRRGPGFNLEAARDAENYLESKGCPTQITSNRGLPKRLTVEIDGINHGRYTDADAAARVALGACTNG